MRATGNHNLIARLAVCLLVLAFVFANFVAQAPQPSPTSLVQPSPEPSPSASVTPTPPRMPTPTPLPGAQNAHQWGSITVFNGLPSDSVRAIAQTSDGVMWFGTDNGLARFDGRRIQKISVGEAGAGSVTALKMSQAGELWVGTRNGAMSAQAGGRLEVVENTRGEAITAILSTAETYLGTESGRIMRVRRDGSGVLVAEAILTDPVQADDGSPLAISSLVEVDGRMFVGTVGKGVFVVNENALHEFQTSPRPVFVNSMAAGGGGRIWLGTDAAKGASGVYSGTEGSKAEKISAPTSDVFALEANDGGLWAGTERFGLFHISEGKLKKSFTFANTSGGLRSDTIYALFTDREGVLWIGTNRGVSRFDRAGPLQETVSDIANSNFIRSLFQASKVWTLAGSNRGLFRSEGKGWKNVPGFEGKVIHAIAEHTNASVMVGTSVGLFDLSGRSVAPGDFRDFANFRSRTYAAVFGRGVIAIPPGPKGSGLPDKGADLDPIQIDEDVTAVADGTERLWIGTASGGLYSFDGQTVRSEAPPELLNSGAIRKMVKAPDGVLWIAGEHGIFAFHEGQPEKIIEAADVRDLYVSGSEIWAATTTRGIVHARRDERFGWLASSIGFEQGLPSEKAFAILPEEGNFLFATNRGVVTYYSGTTGPKLIPVRVLSQRVHDLSEAASTIALEYPQNSLIVEVAGQSSRTFPEEFQYAFVLSNSKGEMIDSRVSNDAQFSPQNLPAGEYTIESRAFDRDLNSSEPLFIRFSVGTAPFPWTATALGVLLAISLFGLVWAVIEHRRIRLRNSELAAARFDLANEAERERRRIARDLHDQTLADLRALLMNSDRLAVDGSFRSEIESVSTDIRRICEDLSPSVLENVGLVAALDFLLSRTVEGGRFTADESADDRIAFPVNVQLQIYRIAQEVLTNISKHSDARAVEMSVDVTKPRGFRLLIRDDGKLFKPTGSNGSGRGVANIRSRANLIGAKVKWKADERGGNLFALTLTQDVAAHSAA